MKKTGGKQAGISLFLTCFLLLTGCAQKRAEREFSPVIMDFSKEREEIVRVENIEQPVTFAEAVALSDSIGIAEYIGCREKEEITEYQFKIVEKFKGEFEEEINLFDYSRTVYLAGEEQEYTVNSSMYETGKTISSVYDIKDETSLREAISGVPYSIDSTEDGWGLKKLYTEATDVETIIKESDYVLEIEVSAVKSVGEDNGNFYLCKVLNVLKEKSPLIKEESMEELQIKFLKNRVEIGGKYIVILNHVSETSYLYLQSAVNGIINIEEAEKVKDVKDALNIQEE